MLGCALSCFNGHSSLQHSLALFLLVSIIFRGSITAVRMPAPKPHVFSGTFITPVEYRGKALLYIETGDHCHDPQLPPFIPLDREVTDDPDYNNMAIAQNDYSALDGGRTQTRLSITVSDLGMSMRSMGNISSMLHGLSSPKHRDKEMRKPFPEMIPGIPALNPN